jgi:hypothetical protein
MSGCDESDDMRINIKVLAGDVIFVKRCEGILLQVAFVVSP